MSWVSSDLVRFDLPQDQNTVAKLKSACNSIIIGPRVLGYEPTYFEIMNWEASDVTRFYLGPLLQGQMRIARFNYFYF